MSGTGPKAAAHMDVRYVAGLARLDLTADEVEEFQRQLDHLLDYLEQLRALDVTDVEPTAHAVDVRNVLRDDTVRPGLDRDRVLANAPRSQDGQFVVPKIIE